VELVIGDVRHGEAVRSALRGVDTVFHLAAAVGVGQSMYQIEHYTSVNNLGTAVLLEALVERPVRRLIVASSMSIYGEGLYRNGRGEMLAGEPRSASQLRNGQWEITDADGEALEPVPTPETKQPSIASVYALGKYDQERMCLVTGGAYGIETTALRFFNVFGPRQSLSNPYTGVLAIFASRLLNDNPPLIFEDGLQRRDFVSVHDVARACLLAMHSDSAAGEVFNIASGRNVTVRQLASDLAGVLGKAHLAPQVTGKYRAGDIRHCFADVTRARAMLNYQPQVSLAEGFAEMSHWLAGQVAEDRVSQASAELDSRGLTV
jgi:dTDP-L-rhamnose 4-epimerase